MTMTIDDPKFIASWQKVKNGWDAVIGGIRKNI